MKTQKQPKTKKPSEEGGVTKEEFLKILKKVTRPIVPKSKSKPDRAKSKTSL